MFVAGIIVSILQKSKTWDSKKVKFIQDYMATRYRIKVFSQYWLCPKKVFF